MNVIRLFAMAVFLASHAVALNAIADDSKTVDFSEDIRPILSNHCFACHGPDENHREAGVRLDIPDEVDLDSVIERIESDDPEMIMPPPKLNKPLSKKQTAKLKQWIEDGGEYHQHWSFVAPQKSAIPNLIDKTWSDDAIDQFVLARLEKNGLHPSPPADKRTLIRRVTFDLTGLPPTIVEVEMFINDSSPDAYAKLVDDLLSRPQYGEHLARFWLDLVRFADTNGLHHDHYREMTPYRDWVIRSFNDNLPYDQFITDQLAGDLPTDPTTDQLIASGFNRLHLIIDVGTALPEESFHRNVVDQVAAFGATFVGLTTQCAVCHDHKYDPITQKDFYQLYAFFNNVDAEPETGRRGTLDFKRGLQSPYIDIPSDDQIAQLRQLDEELNQLRDASTELERQLIDAADARTKATAIDEGQEAVDQNADEEALIAAAEKKLTTLQAQQKSLKSNLEKRQTERDVVEVAVPAALIMKERSEIRPATIMVRGNYDQPGSPVERNTPSFLPPMPQTEGVKTRMDLAHWLTDRTNPLTARVAVNRFWQQCFGIGLVKTSEDFGAQGQPPSHPLLLDYLAVKFVDSGWDTKALLRSIVLSKTYQQSSRAQRERFVNDPENRMLARGSRFRLDAEMVRDQILAVTGLLSPTMYGKSVKPPQPPKLWEVVTMPSSFPNAYEPDKGDKAVRRSVYTFWKRAIPPPQLAIFDAPTREACIARRERTNTPLQALVLMNEQSFFAASIHLANSLIAESGLSDEQRIVRAYEITTSHPPSPATLAKLQAALKQFRKMYNDDSESVAKMFGNESRVNFENLSDTTDRAELAAWTLLVHSLLNLDEVKTRE